MSSVKDNMFRKRHFKTRAASPPHYHHDSLPFRSPHVSTTSICKWIAIFAAGTCVYLLWYYHGWLVLYQNHVFNKINTRDEMMSSINSISRSNPNNNLRTRNDLEEEPSLVHSRHDDDDDDHDHDDHDTDIIADPTSLVKGIATFCSINSTTYSVLVQYDDHHTILTTLLYSQPHLYWNLLEHYGKTIRDDMNRDDGADVRISPEYACALGPGRGFEQDYGYRLLSEKIQMHNLTENNNNNNNNMPRILCLVYTYPKMRQLQRTQALTWGWQCDGYLAFSTESIPQLGVMNLTTHVVGDESYDNMWQKVRSIWMYVYANYLEEYDFFHLGGDDLFVLVANLKKFLVPFLNQTDAVYLGQWIPLPGSNNDKHYYVSGGPGYTLNQVALKRLVTEVLPKCRVHTRASYEDRLVSQCFREMNITGGDTRNYDTGEQRYHDVGPSHLYTFRSTTTGGRGSFHAKTAAYWERLSFPNQSGEITVGPKHELQAADAYSVSFHDIYHPLYMARLHSILYPETCPSTTPLGRALRYEQGDC
jgi:glycoprotein-N-acetylgalactosamine 3-beta-galactosyltransferase